MPQSFNTIVENFKILSNLHKRYGKTIRIWNIKMNPIIITSDADLCEMILNSSRLITKSDLYDDMLVPWLGTGLLTSTGKSDDIEELF